ncbi:hypothetical protein EDB81DRAFT_766938 [Dactylonectria macrodidyma]|uniref:Uncharacterized protein n=1 Tax=Dactylonectria macrodidyma TaxID=307937 RepID=A0A9P9DF79_9HYPO|nr:hypothetical protein EDB81DRAFT_766938 [Dactylonectria macrodidyma]
MVSHVAAKRCPKEYRLHDEIQRESPASGFCGYCGQQWPQPIEVDASDDETSSYSHPLGLPIRLITLLIIGERRSTFFIPRKTEKLGTVDLDPLPFHEIETFDAITEEQWVNSYVRPNYEDYFARDPQWKIGKSWSKENGIHFLPMPKAGQGRTITDLFQKPDEESGYGITWEIQDGRIVVYFAFQDEISQARTDEKKRPKKTTSSKARSTKIKQEALQIDPASFDSSPPPSARTDEILVKEERFDSIDVAAFESTSQLDKASDLLEDDDEQLFYRTPTPSSQPPKRGRPQSQAPDDFDQGLPKKPKRTGSK